MTKKKRKETAYEENVRSALVGLQGAHDEAREAFNRVFERLEAKASRQLERIVGEAREGSIALAAALHDVLAESHAVVAELRDGAAAECAATVQRVEDTATQREAALERVYTETTERILSSKHAMDEHTQQLSDQATHHVAGLLVSMDGDVEELQSLARRRIEDALTSVEEQFTSVMRAAAERSHKHLAQAEADGQALRGLRERSESDADSVVERAQEVFDRAAEAGEALDLIRGYATTARDVVDRLAEDGAEARSDDSLHPETETEHALLASVQPQPVVSAGSEEFGSDALSEAPDDDNFFGRLAAELRDDPDQGEFPCGDEPDDEVPAWAAAPAGTVPSPSGSAQQVAVLETATAQPLPSQPVGVEDASTNPVNVTTSLAAVTACIQQLARSAAEQSLRMELVQAAPHRNGGSSLRLTAYDSAGWWEYHDVAATADSDGAAAAVVDIGELREALGALNRFVGGSVAQIVLDGDVTVGNHLLSARDPQEVPALSDDRKPIERVDLQGADGSGLVIESQVGRLFVPRELLGCLRRRQASAVELVMVDGLPCLSIQVNGSTGNPAGMIVARLQELGEHDAPGATERRTGHENEVTQLVSALSTATTPAELSRILKVGVGYVRRRAAAHPALAKDLILDLIREGTEAMRAAAASNASIGSGASDLAAADSSSLVRATVAANPAITAPVLARLAADPDAQVRAHAASNPVITPDLLAQLAEDHDSSVRAAVASHERVPLETLLVLARDPDPSVCAAVARNPICPADVLRDLVGIVPDSVLANPNAPHAVLVAGSTVDDPRLRATVAGNSATPVKRLRKLAQDNDLDVLRAVADNPQTPPSARRRVLRQLEAGQGAIRDA